MIDPFLLATNGVGPGHSTFNFATMGFGFDIEIIIKPIPAGGETRAGGTGPAVLYPYEPQKYQITVKIRYKGKEWEETRVVSENTALSLENILVWFKSIRMIDMGVTIKNIVINKITPIVNVFKRKKDK